MSDNLRNEWQNDREKSDKSMGHKWQRGEKCYYFLSWKKMILSIDQEIDHIDQRNEWQFKKWVTKREMSDKMTEGNTTL